MLEVNHQQLFNVLAACAAGDEAFVSTLEDASHPIFPNYNHWVIWNIAIQSAIPEAIAHGKYVDGLSATQGIAYGRNKYKGPKPPLKSMHTHVFTIYILDCTIDLEESSRKQNFINNANGHIWKVSKPKRISAVSILT